MASLNNPQLCFNWFNHDDEVRDHGELASIHSMIAHAIGAHPIDVARVFVAGLSAGAASATALAVAYPDVVAGAASFAGGPVGCADSVVDAAGCMSALTTHTAAEWKDRAERAGGAAPWPRLLVVQGSDDVVVSPHNADALVAQWTALHDLPSTATSTTHETTSAGTVDVDHFSSSDGGDVVRSITLHGVSHTLPVDERAGCGVSAPFLDDLGFCGVGAALDFFGL